jgi:dynein heavy chain 1
MKDFPLNDLLGATELDKIRASIVAIFAHLRKIRTTKYPIQRALRLIEAISRDLQLQMLKVLNTRRLMHIPMVEFDKVCLCVDHSQIIHLFLVDGILLRGICCMGRRI